MTAPLILITGATDGIGAQTARALATSHARLIVHGRNPSKLAALHDELTQRGAAHVETLQADLSSLSQVREACASITARHERLDVLLNNAGVYCNERALSVDGHELTFAVNHLAPFLMTHLLLDLLRQGRGRIINVSSIAHSRGRVDLDDLSWEHNFSPYNAYASSKLANVMFTVSLAQRLAPDCGVTVNALHPGVVSTKLLTQGFGMEGPDSLEDGVQTSLYLATSQEVAGITGAYFVRKRQAPMSQLASDDALCDDFYELSAKLTGVTPLARLSA